MQYRGVLQQHRSVVQRPISLIKHSSALQMAASASPWQTSLFGQLPSVIACDGAHWLFLPLPKPLAVRGPSGLCSTLCLRLVSDSVTAPSCVIPAPCVHPDLPLGNFGRSKGTARTL